MLEKIKAIETTYKGIKFRSRLEARWAVFFDACGVNWEYEPEGFELPNGQYYLPDFLLHDVVIREGQESEKADLWVEVKAKERMTTEDARKIKAFADIKEKHFVIEVNGEISEFDSEVPTNPIIVLTQIPEDEGDRFGDFHAKVSDIAYNLYPSEGEDRVSPFNFELIDGDYFAAHLGMNKGGYFALFGDDSNYLAYQDYEYTKWAFDQARQAQFEHGKTPNVNSKMYFYDKK